MPGESKYKRSLLPSYSRAFHKKKVERAEEERRKI
jgi:hypothetical protein